MRLKIPTGVVKAHAELPAPAFVFKPLMAEFSALNDAIAAEVAGIGTDKFAEQVQAARDQGTSVVCADSQGRNIGLSAATSLLKSGKIMKKNMIVPHNVISFDKDLSDHIIVAAFIRGKVEDGELVYLEDDVSLAGWATAKDIQMLHVDTPSTFQTKLPVFALPCDQLRPMQSLLDKFNSGELKVDASGVGSHGTGSPEFADKKHDKGSILV